MSEVVLKKNKDYILLFPSNSKGNEELVDAFIRLLPEINIIKWVAITGLSTVQFVRIK